jgi:triacylglycerol esterase/lipase EstA (alpha/beta hydrolase family)
VNVRATYVFLRDLFAVLPARVDDTWSDGSDLLPNRPTIVLVTGFAATRRSVSAIRKRMLRDGFNVVVLALDWSTLSDGVRGLYRLAERLSHVCVGLRKNPALGNAPVYLVAHSAGGLVARYYVQLLGGSHYCNGLVTMGTPNRGTWIAGLGFFTHLILKARCLWHMLPVSGFVRSINEAEWPEHFPWLAIASRSDYLCPPRTATIPPDFAGLVSVTGSVVFDSLSHSDYLLSKRCYQEVEAFFGMPGKAEPPVGTPTEVDLR